ncbi:MAG: xylose isomerase [Vicinamibacteria bacterium]
MKTYFPEVRNAIPYEGPDSKNRLAFRYFDRNRAVAGRKMSEHLKFAVCYWHTFKGTGSDAFGGASFDRPWGTDESTMEAAFELFQKLGVEYYCFHDRDIASDRESLPRLVQKAASLQRESGVKLLWGTANLFSHPRYTHGAATNPDPLVFAHAASQVRRALEATVELGGSAYVFWGGREGYTTLLNTDLKQEREQMASFLHLASDHAKSIGFHGTLLIEPKPMEPTTHQYDFDAATTLGFLREFDLLDRFMLNIEANHATLATHTWEHDLMVASIAGRLGSLDINRGDPNLGWDTDQFPTDLHSAAMAMMVILNQGGLRDGGLNFDAKVRRGSFDTVDLFHAHIGGMDTFARGLLVAEALIRDGVFSKVLSERYRKFRETDMGRKILARKTSLPELESWAESEGEPERVSGRQEALENVLNDYLYGRSYPSPERNR